MKHKVLWIIDICLLISAVSFSVSAQTCNDQVVYWYDTNENALKAQNCTGNVATWNSGSNSGTINPGQSIALYVANAITQCGDNTAIQLTVDFTFTNAGGMRTERFTTSISCNAANASNSQLDKSPQGGQQQPGWQTRNWLSTDAQVECRMRARNVAGANLRSSPGLNADIITTVLYGNTENDEYIVNKTGGTLMVDGYLWHELQTGATNAWIADSAVEFSPGCSSQPKPTATPIPEVPDLPMYCPIDEWQFTGYLSEIYLAYKGVAYYVAGMKQSEVEKLDEPRSIIDLVQYHELVIVYVQYEEGQRTEYVDLVYKSEDRLMRLIFPSVDMSPVATYSGHYIVSHYSVYTWYLDLEAGYVYVDQGGSVFRFSLNGATDISPSCFTVGR